MAVNLSKGGKVDLTKKKPGLKHLIIGLGWDINKYDGGGEFDLDAAAFMLDASGKAASEADFVFYNNPKHVSGSVVHSGDNRTGAGEGDDEVINVDLSLVPANIEKIYGNYLRGCRAQAELRYGFQFLHPYRRCR